MMGAERDDGGSIEQRISRVLRIGVWTSFLLASTGIVAWFLQHPETGALPLDVLDGTYAALSWVPGLLRGDGASLAMLGLWVLVLTPWLRVVSALAFFRRSGDRVFVVLTALVALLMLLSWFTGTAQA